MQIIHVIKHQQIANMAHFKVIKESVIFSRGGEIKSHGVVIGKYQKHIPAKTFERGRYLKMISHWYSFTLINGRHCDFIYTKKEIKECINNEMINI